MRHEAVQPVVERRRVAQPRQAAPGPDQGLLDGVLGQFRVAEDEAGRGIQARAGRAGELGEGVPVASPCSFHESVLVHDRLSAFGATTVAVLDSLRRWRWPGMVPDFPSGPLPGAIGSSAVRAARRCQSTSAPDTHGTFVTGRAVGVEQVGIASVDVVRVHQDLSTIG